EGWASATDVAHQAAAGTPGHQQVPLAVDALHKPAAQQGLYGLLVVALGPRAVRGEHALCPVPHIRTHQGRAGLLTKLHHLWVIERPHGSGKATASLASHVVAPQ